MRENLDQFARVWQSPPGIAGWFAEVNNQPLGKRFMLTAFIFFLIGGFLAMLMRVQLTVAQNTFLGPQVYNQIFTMHGSTMMYLFAVPFLEGLALYLLPLMIGSRDVAFPRLTSFGYWTFLFGGIVFYASFLFGPVPDAGWFAYTPLSGPRYSGKGVDFWLLGLTMVEIAGITAGAEIVVTILKLRAPGMSLNRIPLFVWAMLAAGIMILFAFTTLLTATVLLELDRAMGTRFFDTQHGGNSLLWQHLFWFFGHPEVYIIFIPATGIVSMVVAASARRFSGYTLVVVAIVITAFVSFGLWVHHMYTTGLPTLSMSFFAAASLMIALASGTQVFAWIATLWGSRPALKAPLLFVLGFLFIFVLGGLTGVMIAIIPFDWQVHDTFFIVAHFHYVLIGGAVFPIFSALHFWLPKITGRMLSDRIGQWSFWLSFIGFNVTFFPMHIMGFLGMPRRVYTYPAELGLQGHNIVSTLGAFVMAGGFLLIVFNVLHSLRRGQPAGANPWNGDSLEWSVSSPPPSYSFFSPPIVHDRHPMWAENPPTPSEPVERARSAMAGMPVEFRATLATDAVAARPEAVQYLPGPSYTPLVAAIGVLVIALGVLMEAYIVAAFGAIFTVGTLIAWLKPNNQRIEQRRASGIEEASGLPVFPQGRRSVAWWGQICLLVVLGTLFAAMFYSYFYIRLFSPAWPQGNLPRPALLLPAIAFALLAASAATQYRATLAFWTDNQRHTQLGLAASFILGVIFLALQMLILWRSGFTPTTNAYASLFHVIHAVLSLLVLASLFFAGALQLRIRRHHAERRGFTAIQMQITNLLWHFMVVVGLLVFAVLHISPYVL